MFLTGVVTSVVSLVHAYYVLRISGLDELVAAIVEVGQLCAQQSHARGLIISAHRTRFLSLSATAPSS
jgi:hypothetical protein